MTDKLSLDWTVVTVHLPIVVVNVGWLFVVQVSISLLKYSCKYRLFGVWREYLVLFHVYELRAVLYKYFGRKYPIHEIREYFIEAFSVFVLNVYYCQVNVSCINQKTYRWSVNTCLHDDVIKWKHFPRYWPFVRGIHRSPVNAPHKGQWRGALIFSLICTWINGWVNSREAGDLRRNHAHYDVIVMFIDPIGRSTTMHSSVWFLCTWENQAYGYPGNNMDLGTIDEMLAFQQTDLQANMTTHGQQYYKGIFFSQEKFSFSIVSS